MKPDARQYDPRPEYLAELVASAGMTKKDVAEKVLGCDPRSLRRYLAGERQFPYTVQFTLECWVLAPYE